MNRLWRWIAVAVTGLLALVVVAYAVVYVLSERILKRTYDVPSVTISLPTDAESIAEGRRLATIRGCFDGCHGKDAHGAVMFDEPLIARIVAPNLTASFRRYSDAQIAAIVRKGLRPELLAEAQAPPEATGEPATLGRYLARTTCTSCHGTDLRGASTPDFVAPDLRIAGAYSPEQFTDLIRRGEGVGGRNLPTMGPWARKALSQFNDEEIGALYAYLHGLAAAQ